MEKTNSSSKITMSTTTVVAVTTTLALIASMIPAITSAGGNGAPSGAHYNLNIIGVAKDKTAPMDGNDGHRIFVKLDGNTKILLSEGETFNVLDANGTDGNGAKFQLPNPDPDNDGITVYSVYARALGTPGGNAMIATCATAPGEDGIFGTADDEEVCSTETLTVERTKGKSSFENVSRELLYIFVDLDGDGTAERYNLFADELQDYFWSYDNNGLKVLQLRFYEMSTNVN
ncbi:MAG: hypothetical protein Q8Q39_01380 [bacterium]|nr:hypothetical protein [bacterium]